MGEERRSGMKEEKDVEAVSFVFGMSDYFNL